MQARLGLHVNMHIHQAGKAGGLRGHFDGSVAGRRLEPVADARDFSTIDDDRCLAQHLAGHDIDHRGTVQHKFAGGWCDLRTRVRSLERA
jgi:hypothetical protein